jgi:hypothetical protein
MDALDKLDVDGAAAMFADGGRLLTVDGRRAEGIDAVGQLFGDCLRLVRSSSHRITAEWRQDNVWIAEVEADYELQDRLQLTGLPRALILRDGPDGFTDLHAYGAHERPLADHEPGGGGLLLGERWIPPL